MVMRELKSCREGYGAMNKKEIIEKARKGFAKKGYIENCSLPKKLYRQLQMGIG